MSKRTRRNHGAAFKAKVALAAIKGEKTLAELTVYPYLPRASVAITSARTYLDLLTGATS